MCRNHDNGGTAVMDVLEALQEAQDTRQPLVVAQLGQSLDGRIATESGHSHYVNGVEARRVLHRLRANVDAVLVGAGTAAADDPQLTVRLCEGENPARVLVDRRRRAGAALKMLADDGVDRLVFGPAADGDPAGVECCDGPDFSPHALLAHMAARGLTRVLVEGGADTVSRFMAAGVVDRLVVLVAPMLIGSGRMGLLLPEIATLDAAIRPPTVVTVLCDGDVMFDCAIKHSGSHVARPQPGGAG